MRFAFCLFRYFPFGGLQRDFLRIAEECVRRGHSVDVYTMSWAGEKNPLIPVNIISCSGWQNHSRNKSFAQQVQSILSQKKYDCVVGFNKMPGLDVYYAADTCFQAKARSQHGTWYRFTPRYRQRVAEEKMVFAKDGKTQILLLTTVQQTEFVRYYKTPVNRFHLLPPGIARDRIAPTNAAEIRAATREEFGVRPEQFLLLLVGSGFKTKGLDRVLLGLAALPNELKKRAKLFVIGDDKATQFLQQAKSLNIAEQVIFLGGRNDVARFFLAADLLLHPAYNESAGAVLLEAVISGLPVLTTDVCGYAHYVKEAKAGKVLLSPYQQTAFNQALRDMLLSPDRKQWQQNGLAFAKQADIYTMPERAADLIESFSS